MKLSDMEQSLLISKEHHFQTRTKINELAERRCWLRPPFASIMRKPFDSGKPVNGIPKSASNNFLFKKYNPITEIPNWDSEI
jgi:hypothetical protein